MVGIVNGPERFRLRLSEAHVFSHHQLLVGLDFLGQDLHVVGWLVLLRTRGRFGERTCKRRKYSDDRLCCSFIFHLCPSPCYLFAAKKFSDQPNGVCIRAANHFARFASLTTAVKMAKSTSCPRTSKARILSPSP